jgi:glucose-6-phosphate 1-dehydrogenase
MKFPDTFVLFGSTGDLAQKKIMPALAKLFKEKKLPDDFSIIAFSRRAWTDNDYYSFIKPSLHTENTETELEHFFSHVHYYEGQFTDESAYTRLASKIPGSAFFYLAVQPDFYSDILQGLSEVKLLENKNSKILVEKPFGHDEESAKKLQQLFEQLASPEQILRVDHYIAKEALQDFLENRKNDALFEQTLSNKHITSIHARIFETIGIEGRGEFYEDTGAIVDVGQNHLMEMIAAVLMDVKLHDASQARAQAIASLQNKTIPVLGQYEGYLNEPEVSANSSTETYFKIVFESTLETWGGIPITIEAGKAMATKTADIILTFKNGIQKIIDIQKSRSGRDAYEIVLEQAFTGNPDYFVGIEEVLASWRTLESVLKKRGTLGVKKYPQGTNGQQ